VSKYRTAGDEPERFYELSEDDKKVLLKWIAEKITPQKRYYTKYTSYGLKHIFSGDIGGFYVSNGEFKGAMLWSGYIPKDRDALNWIFKMSDKSECFKRYTNRKAREEVELYKRSRDEKKHNDEEYARHLRRESFKPEAEKHVGEGHREICEAEAREEGTANDKTD